MKTNRYLLPTYFKIIGWLVSVPTALALLIYLFNQTWSENFVNEFFNTLWGRESNSLNSNSIITTICLVMLMAGLLFIAFSKEKIEDEYIAKLRGDSLIWAVIANAVLIIILSATVYGVWFIYVSFFNLYTVLILFIIKFNLALHCFKKQSGNEEQFKS